jgi:electron transport complex protein RnfB
MHTVIAAQCTGCELCVPPCPVDCIVLEPAPWSVAERALRAPRRAARAARLRFAARNARLARTRSEHRERLAARTTQPQAKAIDPVDPALEKKRAIVERAQARARARLAAVRSGGTR